MDSYLYKIALELNNFSTNKIVNQENFIKYFDNFVYELNYYFNNKYDLNVKSFYIIKLYIDVYEGKNTDKYFKSCTTCGKEYFLSSKNLLRCKKCFNNDLVKCKIHNVIHKRLQKCYICAMEHSRKIYTEKNSYKWIECPVCGHRAEELGLHIKYVHNMHPKKFKELYNMKSIKSQKLCDKMKGNKNPAYKHGGKYSPYSDNFIYADKINKEELYTKNSISQKNNGNNQLTLKYWLKITNNDENLAKLLLSKRQSTFSLEKCISKHGRELGVQIWQERQENWQNSLKNKSIKEIEDINKRKSNYMGFRTLWNIPNDNECKFYILDIGNNKLKIGITTNSLYKRYKTKDFNILLEYKSTVSHCFQIEQILKRKFYNNIISPEEQISEFGWTETFKNANYHKLLLILERLKNKNYTKILFNKLRNHNKRKINEK